MVCLVNKWLGDDGRKTIARQLVSENMIARSRALVFRCCLSYLLYTMVSWQYSKFTTNRRTECGMIKSFHLNRMEQSVGVAGVSKAKPISCGWCETGSHGMSWKAW